MPWIGPAGENEYVVLRRWDNRQDMLMLQEAKHTATVGPFAERHAGIHFGP